MCLYQWRWTRLTFQLNFLLLPPPCADTLICHDSTRIAKNEQTVLTGCELFFLSHGDELRRPLTGYSPSALRHDHGLVYMCPPFIYTCINLRRLPNAMSHFIPLTKWLNDRLLRKLVAHLPAVTACVSNTVTQVIPCRLFFQLRNAHRMLFS